ncbi:hypothetical protein [Vibrio parahaemolyticus]|uniref:hypothetical protein n=1 Tax=Vibrio parahaemolyticus TaxID=670 RepID=UPI0031CC562F
MGLAKKIAGFLFCVFCFLLGLVAFYAYMTDKDVNEYVSSFMGLIKPLAQFLWEIILDFCKNVVSELFEWSPSPEEIPLDIK